MVTSGLGGSYAPGLIIGTVVKVDTRQGESTRRVIVSPNDTTGALEEVLVVFGVGAVGAVVALLLQIVVAPNIALFSAQPNFLLAYVLVVAIARPLDAGSALPFALGLVCDLLGSGPVGGYAFLFVIVSFIASRAFSVLDNDTLFMPVTIFVVATFAAEMLYGALLIGLGLSASPVDAFLYRALPCTLYDCVVGLVLYPIIARLLASGAQDRGPRTPRLR